VFAEDLLSLAPGEADGAIEEPAARGAFEDPERVPFFQGPRSPHVGVGVPPPDTWFAGDVLERVVDLERADEVESRWRLRRPQAGEKDDEVTSLRAAEAEGAAGAAAVVTVGRRGRRQVGIEVNGELAPRARCIDMKAREVAKSQHRLAPCAALGMGSSSKVPSSKSGDRAECPALTPTLARKAATKGGLDGVG